MGNRTRLLILLAAAAAVGIAAFLLLRDRGAMAPMVERVVPERHRHSPGFHRYAPQSPPESESAEAGGIRLDLRTVVEGDWALPGVMVLAVERDRDGSLVAMIGDDAPDDGETDSEGRITLRYKTEPAERLFGVLGDKQIFESAENAEPTGALQGFSVFRARTSGPVVLRFRDPPGAVWVRPVDAATGELLAGRQGNTFRWVRSRAGKATLEEFEWAYSVEEAWLWASYSYLSDSDGLRLLVPGYLPVPAPRGGWRGRVVLPMKPDPSSVRARIVVPEGWSAWPVLRHGVGGAECRSFIYVLGLAADGQMALSGVPTGEWVLEVRACEGFDESKHLSRVARRFHYSGSGIDLGEMQPR